MSKENKSIFIIVIVTDYIVKLWCNLIVSEFFNFWGDACPLLWVTGTPILDSW